MHIARTKWRSRNNKVYESIYLRETYRKNGKVQKRQIANLTHCSPEDIAAIELALKHKEDLSILGSSKDIKMKQGKSFGAVWAVYQITKRLGIEAALGLDFQGRLALWQVIARVIDQGSRLSAVRLAKVHAACDILGINKKFHENHLYGNLSWLCAKQEKIESYLFRHRTKKNPVQLFLYDVTSSYLEGTQNELGAFGYNRDKKRGKQQVVVGLLCDEHGVPVSTEVFEGNTQDLATFKSQIQKVADSFGCQDIIFVGDRGMIKSKQINQLQEAGFQYITAIGKPQVQALLNKGVIQLEMFDETICEIEHENERYILRRNPHRAKEIAQSREERTRSIRTFLMKKNQYLQDHFRAAVSTAHNRIQERIEKLRVEKWVSVISEGRVLKLVIDEKILREESQFDGCYVLKTNVSKERVDAQTIHDRYKDLYEVEKAFRDCKTVNLELRPIYVRTAEHTRAHALVVMLAYMVIRELRRSWQSFDLTVEEGLDELKTLCTIEMETEVGGSCLRLPDPSEKSKKLLAAMAVTLPKILPRTGVNVDTLKKLTERRKSS